jgi:hypothetical protein
VVMMVLWSISGIWLWWEIKPTRRYGLVAVVGGAALFTLFAILI